MVERAAFPSGITDLGKEWCEHFCSPVLVAWLGTPTLFAVAAIVCCCVVLLLFVVPTKAHVEYAISYFLTADFFL